MTQSQPQFVPGDNDPILVGRKPRIWMKSDASKADSNVQFPGCLLVRLARVRAQRLHANWHLLQSRCVATRAVNDDPRPPVADGKLGYHVTQQSGTGGTTAVDDEDSAVAR
eukprot:CAMPEP_0119420578 /NCGR_PEP_ID=MMETSP1335-20130426/23838_1 /TAXON_ID=259385 /ORGANISM="Chrysoculter rhomboideus, Strain RCC1486" /LENGTH=110 /DNA_ID=CAMNT_0007445943 /DNA_START=70 /DNA_END=402 /DNA_ORIENTATION=+